MTPPNSMPVKRRISSGVAKETSRALIFLRSPLLTSKRVVARTTQATSFCSPVLIAVCGNFHCVTVFLGEYSCFRIGWAQGTI